MSMTPERIEEIITQQSDINRYDDDNFSSPVCIDELPEDDKAEVLEWLSNILKACASETVDAVTFELLAALEESQQQLTLERDRTNYWGEREGTAKLDLIEAQQTIARQREALKFYASRMCIQKEDVGWNVGFIAREALRATEEGGGKS